MKDLVKKEALQLLSDAYFSKNDATKALEVLKMIGDKKLFIEFGDKCLKHGKDMCNKSLRIEDQNFLTRDAFNAFVLAKSETKLIELGKYHLSQNKPYWGIVLEVFLAAKNKAWLITCGEYLLKEGHLRHAREAFRAAKTKISKEQFIECGNLLLGEGYINDAKSAFRSAGIEIPKEKIIKCGLKLLKDGYIHRAVEVYKMAGVELPHSETIACADVCLFKHHYLSWAKMAFKLLNQDIPKDKLIEYGHLLLLKARFREARGVFKLAGKEIPKYLLREYGDKYIATHFYRDALDVFKMLNDKKGLIRCGRACYKVFDGSQCLDISIEAFKAAKAKDELIKLGEFLVDKKPHGYESHAYKVFEVAASIGIKKQK